MKPKHIRMGLLFILAALLATACSGPSRSASTPVVVPGQNTGEATDDQPGQAATDAPSQVETLMAGSFATMTAAAIEAGSTTVPQPEQTTTPQEIQPPVENPTAVPATPTPKPPDPTPKPKADCTSPYTVKKGDWVWNIGRRCNIDPNSIIAANGLVYPFIIYPGDILILPSNAPPFKGP